VNSITAGPLSPMARVPERPWRPPEELISNTRPKNKSGQDLSQVIREVTTCREVRPATIAPITTGFGGIEPSYRMSKRDFGLDGGDSADARRPRRLHRTVVTSSKPIRGFYILPVLRPLACSLRAAQGGRLCKLEFEIRPRIRLVRCSGAPSLSASTAWRPPKPQAGGTRTLQPLPK
jgi:hypothetical protein